MRPLELRLSHFGPYRDEAILDFTALDRLFLVCGPTGAGKTTLFDALTFALYEKTPGTRGGLTDQLVSHHAPEGSVPRVTLRFSLGAQEWQVERRLKHRVRKQRGDGWKEQDAQVVLQKKVDGVWEAIPGKRSEINAHLEALLGLSAEEFAKIVVLPQGDFQRFLESTSNDREKMLQKLFPVEAYERLVEALKVRAKVLEDERRRWEDRWEELTGQLGAAADRPFLEAAQAEASARAQACAAEEARLSATLVQLQGLQTDWATLGAKRAEQARLEGRRPETEAGRQRMDRARQARSLGADLDRQNQILAEGRGLRTTQDGLKADLTGYDRVLAAAAEAAGERSAREARLEEILKRQGVLEGQKKAWDEAKGLAAGETTALRDETAAEVVWKASQGRLAQATTALPPVPEGPGWDQALAAAALAREHHQGALTREADLQKRQTLGEQRRQAAQRTEVLAKACAQADTEVTLWTEVTAALKAASLAETLAAGEPCPVCGSVEHPAPAAYPKAASEAPRRLEAAGQNRDAQRTAWAAARAQVEALDAQWAALGPEIPPGPGLDETAAALAAAEAQVAALQVWDRDQKAAQAALTAATSAEAAARDRWRQAVQAREGWTTRRTALADAAPTDPGPEYRANQTEEVALRRRLEDDRQKVETVARQRQTAAVRIDELEKQLEAQREEYRRLQNTLEAAAVAQGWSLDEARAARVSDRDLAALEESVAAFDRDSHRLAGEQAALEARFPDGAPAPTAPVEAERDSQRTARQAAETEAKEHEFALRQRDKVEDELRVIQDKKAALESEFQKVVPLAKALDGRNEKNLKLTTWVLVQALEQVAASATHRLESMSGGRYGLKVQTEGSDGRKDWGLDLAVIDSYTGQERAVGTLSGGEKFMTSISLALGLADVIQERSGGLKLEAIFIDEGFGTLDDQSLDRAMAILHDLGQHRSVGIISHVAELRQRINSRVEVVKGKNGSSLKVG